MGLIFKISKLAASFEALSHLRAIKTGDSWAWCTKFGAKTWFFTEIQGNCKNWCKSKNPNSTNAKFGSMLQNIGVFLKKQCGTKTMPFKNNVVLKQCCTKTMWQKNNHI